MTKKAIIFDWIGTLYERDIGLFPDVIAMLQRLKKKYKLALITIASQGAEARIKELEAMQIKEFFDSIVVDSVKTQAQFLTCIDELGVKPSETIVVGDRMSREISVGNALGCTTIWIAEGDRSFDIPTKDTGEPTHTINSISEFEEVLK